MVNIGRCLGEVIFEFGFWVVRNRLVVRGFWVIGLWDSGCWGLLG